MRSGCGELVNRTGLNRRVSISVLSFDGELGLSVSCPLQTASLGHNVEISIPFNEGALKATAKVASLEVGADCQVLDLRLVQFERAEFDLFQEEIAKAGEKLAIEVAQVSDLPDLPGDRPSPQEVRGFLADSLIAVIDPWANARTFLSQILVKLGVGKGNVMELSGLEAAMEGFKNRPAKVIFSNYFLGRNNGYELFRKLKSLASTASMDWRDTVFSVYSERFSPSLVAEAAELGLEGLLPVPLNQAVIEKTIGHAISRRRTPSAYSKGISHAQRLIESEKFQEAVEGLKSALDLDPKPTLAHYLLGICALRLGNLQDARTHFENGLSVHALSTRCLDGVFEVCYAQEKFAESYDVLQRLSRLHGLTSKRLETGFRLSIMLRRFDDLERMIQDSTRLGEFAGTDSTAISLRRHACAALIVCGKQYMAENLSRARIVFEKAVDIAPGKEKVIQQIAAELVRADRRSEAEAFIKRFSEMSRSEPSPKKLSS